MFGVGFLLLLAPLIVQAAQQSEPVSIEGESPLEVALWMCNDHSDYGWQSAGSDDAFVSGVRDYWDAANSRLRPKAKLDFAQLHSDSGVPMGIYRQLVLTPGVGAQTRSCTIHFRDLQPPISKADVESFATTKASEKLIGVLYNETTWEAFLPAVAEWDYVHASRFAANTNAQGAAAAHPFSGTQIKFIKVEL